MPTTSAAAAGERISVREFARLAACDDKQVRRAIHLGRIPVGDDGLVDAALVDGGWRRFNRRARPGSRGYATPRGFRLAPTPLEKAARLFAARLDQFGFDQFLADMLAGKLATVADAERIKANALALRHLLAARNEAKRLVASVAAPQLGSS